MGCWLNFVFNPLWFAAKVAEAAAASAATARVRRERKRERRERGWLPVTPCNSGRVSILSPSYSNKSLSCRVSYWHTYTHIHGDKEESFFSPNYFLIFDNNFILSSFELIYLFLPCSIKIHCLAKYKQYIKYSKCQRII